MWGRGESTFVDINDVAEGDVRLAVGLARDIIDLSGVGVLAWRSFLVEGGGVLLFRLLARERVPVTGPMGQGLVGGYVSEGVRGGESNMALNVMMKVVIDVLLLLAVAFPILLFFVLGEPYKRGFYCNDETLSYPYKDSTISNTALYIVDNKHHWSDVLAGSIVGTTVAVLVALFVSDLFPKYSEKHGKNMKPLIETELTDTTDRSDGHRTPESSQNSAKSRYQGYVSEGVRGGESNMALNVMMKVVIDVLLLLAVAFPILLFFVLGEPYKRGFYCNDETLSYPYKDSTISNTALYIVDNKHHWSDVLAGSIVGTTVAVLVALFVSDLFPKYSEKHGKNMKPLIETELTDTTDRSDGHRTPESSQNSAKSRYQGCRMWYVKLILVYFGCSFIPFSKEAMSEDQEDERFRHIRTDPRFRPLPKNERKVKIDKRFQAMFKDQHFKVKCQVDKRGRPLQLENTEDLRRFYHLSSSDESSVEDDVIVKSDAKGENVELMKNNENMEDELGRGSDQELPEKTESDGELPKNSVLRKKLMDMTCDYARGEGKLLSSSSDEDSDNESNEDVEHPWGELDNDAQRTDTIEETSKVAVCNMDWDRLKAVDIMVLMSSFLPSGGLIKSVKIYPSEFGKQRMRDEAVEGPKELLAERAFSSSSDEEGETEEGKGYHVEKLRQYQLNRLKYYYAIVECDSHQTASCLYEECDGAEYESTATRLDLRLVPDTVTFEDEPRDQCSSLPPPGKYKPKFFINTALQQANVDCTWDETDPERSELLQKAFEKGEGEEENLEAYLASDTSNSEPEEEAVESDIEGSQVSMTAKDRIAKYRELIQDLEKKHKKKKEEKVEMEITWDVGLKDRTEELVKQKKEKASLTPWEEYLKKKEKSKRKIEEETQSEEYSSDNLPADVDLNDPFFKTVVKEKKQKKKKVKNEEEPVDNTLHLLTMTADVHDDRKQHFNYKDIVKGENESKTKKKRRLKSEENQKDQEKDEFQVDVNDSRFSALFSSHHFNVDPSHQHFKKTRGMEAIIAEKQKRITLGLTKSANLETADKKLRDNEMKALVQEVHEGWLSVKCEDLLKYFSHAVSEFTHCAVRFARPIHLCEKCVQQYLNVSQAHHAIIMEQDENSGEGCISELLNADRIQIVETSFQFTMNLWEKAACDNCFEKYGNGTLTTDLNNVTKSFMAQYKKMLACLQNQTEVLGVHGIGPDTWSGKTRNVTCDRCQDSYRALNYIYADVLGDIDADHICMDIVDAMNMTRMVWSQNLKCTQRNVTAEAPFIVVTCMCILPPLFYLLAWCLPQHQRGPIIRQKRWTTYGTVARSPEPLAEHGVSPLDDDQGCDESIEAQAQLHAELKEE
ncbi:unnamed protein product [Darwinula stevensoni]|uniref:Uncharacterized protein n=1 Tax=Darwinula stevensoni TaxID=69355 RepID=A0A7R9AAC7_9CRUS|nr:unnamed protein product [Darwinula stevensoni]CAG0898289.1 unnamed protein product [Darwinula stevensoni]